MGEGAHSAAQVHVVEEALDRGDPGVGVVGDETGRAGFDGGAEGLSGGGDSRRLDQRGLEPLDRALRLVERHRRKRREVDVQVSQHRRQVEPRQKLQSPGSRSERRERVGHPEVSAEPQLDLGVSIEDGDDRGLDRRPVEVVGVGAAEIPDSQRPG